jgi:hypothetical protein
MTQSAKRCRSCGLYDGQHERDCRVIEREARAALQSQCDHAAHGITQTTGDVLGPPCCGGCGIELSRVSNADS